MKISHLQENLTPSSAPSAPVPGPKFGRSDEMLESGTGSGTGSSTSTTTAGVMLQERVNSAKVKRVYFKVSKMQVDLLTAEKLVLVKVLSMKMT